MISAKQIQCGQYKKYDDFYRIWDIETDESREAVLKYCFSELYKRSYEIPQKDEWRANIRIGGAKDHDMSYYFHGYYDLVEYPVGSGNYKFEIVEPYAD